MPPPLCRLYLITPPRLDDLAGFGRALAHALDAGDVAALQIRIKDAPDDVIAAAVDALSPIALARGVAVILNDRPDLAAKLGCDGVHIGQDDPPYAEARRLMGPGAMIGVTCHDSRHLAMEAAEAGADYVAFGAFFPSGTKAAKHRAQPELLRDWSDTTVVPCVAIGGITQENCGPLVEAGADFLAVIGAIWSYPRGPRAAVSEFNDVFARYGRAAA
jgi:thiamine-phosphate pyrophosphorylase